MKTPLIYLTFLLGAATLGAALIGHAQTNTIVAPANLAAREAIVARGREAVDAHLKSLESNRNSTGWIGAAMWIGLAEFAEVSGRSKEMDAIRKMGEAENWQFPRGGKPHHADFDAIGQTYLTVYARSGDAESLRPTREDMDELAHKLNSAPPDAPPVAWTWCDALFMAPPVMAQLSQITGDRKYIDAMDKEWWRTSGQLYDADEHLFFRDKRFLDKTEPNGKKMFWSRGNGWVFAGLARVLTFMPRDYPTRPRYEQQFREMSAKLRALQGKDGMWRSSLLDAARFPQPESSGTAFYCYGMAWGINNGLLPRADYEDSIARAWRGLLANRRADNIPGFVQNVGDRPGTTKADQIAYYGTGAFLLAATELAKMQPAPALLPTEPRAFARHVPERLDDIAWENNRITFRVYGPQLEAKEQTGSGIDVWAKSTRRIVMGKGDWYAGKYHRNSGEGSDFYEVGQTRGCGGLGIWDGTELHVSRTWVSYKILDSGPDQARVEIIYAPWKVGDRNVWETRTITLEADSQLNRIESVFGSDKPGELMVGLGIAKTEGDTLTLDATKGWMATWSKANENGALGCGVLADPKAVIGTASDADNYLLLVRALPDQPIIYYAGAGWDQSGYFASQQDWLKYLANFKR